MVSQLDELSCNTRKTKDKRDRRHTVGILVGTKPCGTVVLFNELYGSESVTQVYASVVDYIANLPEEQRPKVINYDDACHLVKFAKNHYKKSSMQNENTKFMTEVPIVVDKFHFRNHIDKWCQENCNPYKIAELNGVNTESCEQTFQWVNKYTAVKSMNESSFYIFFTVLFDMHNLSKLGQVRSVANPKSELRWQTIEKTEEYEHMLLGRKEMTVHQDLDVQKQGGDKENVDILSNRMDGLNINKFVCEECGATYKVSWTLKAHMTKKHGHKFITCDECGKGFSSNKELEEHQLIHNPKEKLHVCDVCKEIFSCKKALDDHKSLHATKEQEQLFVCRKCKEIFFNENDLTLHEKAHLTCDICKRVCSTLKQLNRHISTHK